MNGGSILAGRKGILIGGQRIGQTIGRRLLESGMDLAVTYLESPEEASGILRAAEESGRTSFAVHMDVTKRSSVISAAKEIQARFPEIHLLLNLASVFDETPWQQVTERDWTRNLDVHVLGGFWPAQTFAPKMPPGSQMIFVSDRTAIGRMYAGYLPYAVSKSAVAALTRALAVEMAPRGIFVNAIAPGPILRPPAIPESEWLALRDSSALKFQPDDELAVRQFADLVLYLASNVMASGYVYPLDEGFNL